MRTGAAHRLSPYLHPEDFLPTADGIVFKRELIFPDDRPAFFVPCVGHDVEVRRPHLKLTLPVDDGGERGTDQVRPFRVALLRETKPKLLPPCQEAEQLIAIPGTAVCSPPCTGNTRTRWSAPSSPAPSHQPGLYQSLGPRKISAS